MNALHQVHRTLLSAAALTAGATSATAQFHFSIDYHGPTISAPDSAWLSPITEGDLLYPTTPLLSPMLGPLPTPSIERAAGPGGIPPLDLGLIGYAPCVGHTAGTPCVVEVDALSFGTDNPMSVASDLAPAGVWLFSVDEYARGLLNGAALPQVATEAPFGEAAADVFTHFGTLPGPLPPGATPPSNLAVVDGDGLISPSGFLYPGVGIVEPTFSVPAGAPSLGDDLDALDTETPHGFYPVYFSLEGGLFDPLAGVFGSGSAGFHGFSGADVLVTPGPGVAPSIYASAGSLGLNLLSVEVDDLDALIIAENGVPGFQAPLQPNHWATGQSDMLLFSVRRGSAVIGSPDSLFGLPIEEGDILMTPIPGGLSPFPAIYCAAENLGLRTRRNIPGLQYGDDLDAADTRFQPMWDCDGDGLEDVAGILMGFAADCNGNSMPDSCDIANGTSLDLNGDGIPDECATTTGTTVCVGDGSLVPCPCGNNSLPGSGQGCKNSSGVGATLTATGTWGPLPNNFTVHVAQAIPNQPALLLRGSTLITIPFKDGLLCMGNPTERVEVLFLYPNGTASTLTQIGPPLANPGGTYYFQVWYRNPVISPCGTGSNFSAGLQVP